MTNESVSTWICGSCKRRVPPRVAECRCGATRPEASLPVLAEEIEEGPSPLRGLLKGAAFLLLVGLSVVWYSSFGGAPAKPRPLRLLPVAAPSAPPAPEVASPVAPRPESAPAVAGVPGGPTLQPSASDPWAGLRVSDSAARTPRPVRQRSVEPLSEADSRRIQGLLKLRQVYSAIAAEAGHLTRMAETYDRNCGAGQIDSRCPQLFEQIGRSAVFVGVGLDEAEEICRTHWLEPGLAREAREALGLDDQVWDEIAREVRKHR